MGRQVCGWYGKLPAVGDFASRRLPPAVVARCDAWLSAGLSASQRTLGADWLDLYLTSPIWRFVWGPGTLDEAGRMGVLMPSVDRVGRYFPLLLVAQQPDHTDVASASTSADAPDQHALDWLDRLADTAQGCLQPGASLEGFEAALAADPGPPAHAPLWSAAAPGQSLWWSEGSPPHRWTGLPSGTAFTALLQGDD